MNEAPAPKHGKARQTFSAPWPFADRPFYGQPLLPWPMAYAPVNEIGVVFLFGVLCWQLGFFVHRVQAEFPDCEAMRRVGDDKCQLVKIEFELESRNFLRHRHDPAKCDLIVCWRHNWPGCPLEVIELSKVFSDQQSDSAKPLPHIVADKC